jgi:putative flavoprotein involved in K+ transport
MSSRGAIDSVVIGAGPAGLAASAALTERGIEHLVQERARVGQTWRTQRWDSLRRNNPVWMNPMLGEQPPGTYLTASEVVARLARPASALPVREETTVSSVRPYRDRWTVETGAEEIVARTVVVATGNEDRGRTPTLARLLPERVLACHAAEYRSPARLPDGAVLIIGSAQSGYQIAEELLAADRRVIVATSRVGRAPARHRGRETVARTPEGMPMSMPRPTQAPEERRGPPHPRTQLVAGPDWRRGRRAGRTADYTTTTPSAWAPA